MQGNQALRTVAETDCKSAHAGSIPAVASRFPKENQRQLCQRTRRTRHSRLSSRDKSWGSCVPHLQWVCPLSRSIQLMQRHLSQCPRLLVSRPNPSLIERCFPEKHQRRAKVPLGTVACDIPSSFGCGEVLRHPADSLDHVGLGDVRPAAAPLLDETAGSI